MSDVEEDYEGDFNDEPIDEPIDEPMEELENVNNLANGHDRVEIIGAEDGQVWFYLIK